MTRRVLPVWVAAGLAGSVLTLAAPASAAEEGICSEGDIPGTEVLADNTARTNPALERMHVPEAQAIAVGNGDPVKVVVIDSGVQTGLGIDVVGAASLPGLSPALMSGHGTLVAGLVAGPDGVAPGAQVIDVRVFDSADADVTRGERTVTSQGIADGIDRAITLYDTTPFDVVNISLSVEVDDPVLRAAVKRLVALGVVVVASSGNADVSTSEGFEGTDDNDAVIYPADYPGVLGVSAAPPPGGSPVDSVVPNEDTDVAAPTLGALSVNANGQRCEIAEVATSWAAAEVSGVVALLRTRFPKDTAKQTVARLLATTEGSEGASNPWTGAGIVQAQDALTRALAPGRSGRIQRSVAQDRRDAMPPPPPAKLDLFGSSRALLLRFGLGAGALMALAFMLRSLTRR